MNSDSKPHHSQLFRQEEKIQQLFDSQKLPEKIASYQIVAELGRGGMGCVYKAYHRQLDKFTAIKIIKTHGQKERQRFAIEAKTMAMLDHPGIVKIYDFGIENNLPYLIMDFVDGVSLKEYLQQPLTIVQVLKMMVKISEAVAYAHNKGIIHRDLKPANIMIDKRQEPFVMDFGLAKIMKTSNSLSKTGTILGTPTYMSPQQAKGKKVNALTDVYALGAILYEMLAKKTLVTGSSAANIIYNVIHQDPVALRKINANIARDIEIICHTAIAKPLEKRYQSAHAFSGDIKRFLNGEIIQARAASIWEKSWYKIKSNKPIAITIAIGVLTIAIAIWTFATYQDAKTYEYLNKAKKLQNSQKNTDIEVYLKINYFLEKAQETSSNFKIKQQLIKAKEKIGILAKKQKNYLLSYTLFQQSKKLGSKRANMLLNALETEKKKLKQSHAKFIAKAMKKIAIQEKETINKHIDRYVFAIVKMQTSYVVKMLIPFLKSANKWQRLLAIKALGRFGNHFTKFKNKDSVEWLLYGLENFKDKKSIKDNQQEVEEIIWALGWLRDQRANKPVYDKIELVGEDSLLCFKTKIPYRWIPIEKVPIKNSEQFFIIANMKRQKGYLEQAIADFTKVIKLAPTSKAYNGRGTTYGDLGELHKAVVDYTKAIELSPDFAEAYNGRGTVYSDLKKHKKAIADYTKAIELNSGFAKAYNNRGTAYKDIEKYTKAINDFTKAIELNSGYSKAYNNRGTCYYYIGDVNRAIADFTKAIELNPIDFSAHNNRGTIYVYTNKLYEAIDDFTKAIDVNPRHANSYNNRASAYKRMQQYSKALDDYTKAIDLNPKFADVYNGRGSVHSRMRQHQKALADYNMAIKLNPSYALAYNNRATTFNDIKEYDKAIADYTVSAQFNPKLPSVYGNRGSVYLKIQQYQKAYQDFQIFLKLAPNHPLAAQFTRIISRLKANHLIK